MVVSTVHMQCSVETRLVGAGGTFANVAAAALFFALVVRPSFSGIFTFLAGHDHQLADGHWLLPLFWDRRFRRLGGVHQGPRSRVAPSRGPRAGCNTTGRSNGEGACIAFRLPAGKIHQIRADPFAQIRPPHLQQIRRASRRGQEKLWDTPRSLTLVKMSWNSGEKSESGVLVLSSRRRRCVKELSRLFRRLLAKKKGDRSNP